MSRCTYRRTYTDKYPVRRVEGYLVVEIDGKNFLFDMAYDNSWGPVCSKALTGGHVRRTQFAGGQHVCLVPFMGDLKLDGVIGRDLVEDANFTVNLPEGEITFTTEEIEEDEEQDYSWGHLIHPTLEVLVNGRKAEAVFAPGLPRNFFFHRKVREKREGGGFIQHGPLFNDMRVLDSKLKVEFRETAMEMDAGCLPACIWKKYLFGEAVLILGNDLFDRFEVTFIMRNKYKSLRFAEIERKEE